MVTPLSSSDTGRRPLLNSTTRCGAPALRFPTHSGPRFPPNLLPQRLAIVFGGEKEGCSQALSAAATLRVKIPMTPKVESLNVSAAAGIMLYNRLRFNQVGSTAPAPAQPSARRP